MHIYRSKGGHSFFAGWVRNFQGFGFTIGFDNPTIMAYTTHVYVEIMFLYFKCWYQYTTPSKPLTPTK